MRLTAKNISGVLAFLCRLEFYPFCPFLPSQSGSCSISVCYSPCCWGFGRTETMCYGLLDYTATLGIVLPPMFWWRIAILPYLLRTVYSPRIFCHPKLFRRDPLKVLLMKTPCVLSHLNVSRIHLPFLFCFCSNIFCTFSPLTWNDVTESLPDPFFIFSEHAHTSLSFL